MLKLQQLKELIGNQSLEHIFDSALDALLLSEQKKRGVVSSPSKSKNSIKANSDHSNESNKSFRVNSEHSDESKGSLSANSNLSGNSKKTLHANSGCSVSSTSAKKSPSTNPSRPSDLNEHNPQRTETQLKSRFIPIDLKRMVFARSKGQCEHVDPRSGFRCKSRFRLQIDHLRPLVLGGFTESSNLRHLCSAHNLRMATEAGLWRPQNQSQMCA